MVFINKQLLIFIASLLLLLIGNFASAATLISEYNFEEESTWNGTANELKDSAGYTGGPFDGYGAGSPVPTQDDSAPAKSGSTGTCSYANFTGSRNGGSTFTLDSLPVNTANGAKTSVSFWMRWDGTNLLQPIGWHRYNLFFDIGRFGFNTGGYDIWGISSSGLANGWHHVVAVFANGNVQQSELYIDGVKQNLTQTYSGHINNSQAYVASTLHLSGWGASSDWRFPGGGIDEVKVYNGAVDQAQVTSDYQATHNCVDDAILLAEYHLDETSLNGSANEIVDTAGYSGGPFNGQGIGSPIPSPTNSNPAISGTPGTCGYQTLSSPSAGGSAITLDNLPVSTTTGSKTSVSFWMYWNGTNYIMPIGWQHYDIYIAGGYIGFNTSNSDIYGTSSSGLANGWHHIVAVFTNGDATSNKLYIDGTNMPLSQVMGSPISSTAVVQSTLQISGWTGNSNYRFSGGHIDEVKVYKGEVNQAQVTADFAATHTCQSIFELIAEYHLDETSWDGSAGEVEDTAGYSGGPFDAQTIGSPFPNANHTDRARSGTNGTCGYAELNGPSNGGGAISFSSIPFETSAGSKNSMTFWLYWDGTDQVIPIGSNDYNLILNNNNLGFTSNGTDLYGMNFSGYTNGWYHISAIFAQGDYTQNKLYINGAQQTLSQITSNPKVQKAYLDAATQYSGSSYIFCGSLPSPWYSENDGGCMQYGRSDVFNVSGPYRSVLELETRPGDIGNLKANISTMPGDTVYVSFDHADHPSYISSDFDIFIDNQLIATVANGTNSFIHYEYSATTNSTNTLVELKATEPDGRGVILDDIKIETSSSGSMLLNQSVQAGGEAASSTKRFTGRLDEIKFYIGEIDQTQVTADYNATHSCPSYVVNNHASGFNCISEQETDLDDGHLYMQIAGQSFNIQVVALKSDGSAETAFSAASDKNVTLEFLDVNNSYVPITFYDGSNNLSSKTVTFTTSNTTGIVAVNGLTINNAYRTLTCRISDANQSPTLTATSSDNFSVRPIEFTLSSNANADATGTNANATPVVIAGNAFTVNANTNTVGYNGTPLFDTSKRNAHASAPNNGTLTGSFSAANSSTGNASGTNFVYQEVGYVKINTQGVYDTSFTSVDSNNGDCIDSFSNVVSAGKYGCKFRNNTQSDFFGRFIPYHFDVDDASKVTTAGCGSNFTYYGQDGLTTEFQIRAENLGGTLLRNYDGAYAKLNVNAWTDISSPTGLRFSSTNLPAGVTLSASTTPTSGSWNEGLATVIAKHLLSRPVNPVSEVNLSMEMDAIDSDGVGVVNGIPESINQTGNSVFRYGKLSMKNAYGSELQPLSIPLEAQYWDGVTYRKNTLDSCSVINPINITMDNYQKNLAACETSLISSTTMNAGELTLSLSEPGNGNSGSVTLTSNLTTASGSTCVPSSTGATSANLPWFGASNPSAKATFGINKTPIIYIRENY